jgi:hypothetical protein
MSARAVLCAIALVLAPLASARDTRWTHIVESDFVPGEVHVRYAGEVMLSRADYHADAEPLALVRPRQKLVIGMPLAGTMTLSPSDTLRIIGTLERDGVPLRVVVPPRGVAVEFALLLAPDGGFDGSLAFLDHAGNGRLRPRAMPNNARAEMVPRDGRFLPQYRVRTVDTSRPFQRYAWVFRDAQNGQVRVEKRTYQDADPDGAYLTQSYAMPAKVGAQRVGELNLTLLEIEPERLKYRVDAD